MDKRIGKSIILCSFVLIICLLWLFWILFGNSFDNSNNENRHFSEMPKLSFDTVSTFPSEFSDYFNDNIPFRNNLIALNSIIDYYIFGISPSDHVIVGKNDWLFYKRKEDSDPLGCYMGTNLLSDDELKNLANNCVEQRDYLKQEGKEFIIFIAPNKERVYYENMPEQYGTPADNYRALQIVNYLKENTDLRVVYPYEDIMSFKNSLDYNIYYKTDTHWNYIGGYIGAAALLSELGIIVPNIDSDEIKISISGNTAGDLASMINLKNELEYTDYEYTVEGYNSHDFKKLGDNLDCGYVANNSDDRTILIIRDSFAKHMSDYLGSQFRKTYFVPFEEYTNDDMNCYNPDVVVYETVERYVARLGSFSFN